MAERGGQTRRADLVVVGGGPAGLTTAAAAVAADPALRGRLLLLERASYPRDKPCAGAVSARGDAILASLGLRPEVGSVPIDGISMRTSYGEREERLPGIGRVVRRLEFDAALARAAAAAGVEIVERAKVEKLEQRGARVHLITSAGEVEARLVVGADGVGSVVRRAMGAGRSRLRAQALEVDTEPIPGDRAPSVLHFDASDRALPGYTWDFPSILGGQAVVSRGIYGLVTLPGREPPDLLEALRARLAAKGLDLARYPNRRFAECGFAGATALSRGPLLLVGEAAGIDPLTGEGIAQAIEYGALAGPFVAAVLAGRRRPEEWTGAVRRSRLGRDLRVRERLVEWFFGPRRPLVERLLIEDPLPLRLGCAHFGAREIAPGSVAALALRLGALAVRSWVGRSGG